MNRYTHNRIGTHAFYSNLLILEIIFLAGLTLVLIPSLTQPPLFVGIPIILIGLALFSFIIVKMFVLISHRLHDCNLSNFYMLQLLIPYYGIVFLMGISLWNHRLRPINSYGNYRVANTYEIIFGRVSIVINVLFFILLLGSFIR